MLEGSPRYFSPEMMLEGITGYGSDTWAAGLYLYELIAGKLPFAESVDKSKKLIYIELPSQCLNDDGRAMHFIARRLQSLCIVHAPEMEWKFKLKSVQEFLTSKWWQDAPMAVPSELQFNDVQQEYALYCGEFGVEPLSFDRPVIFIRHVSEETCIQAVRDGRITFAYDSPRFEGFDELTKRLLAVNPAARGTCRSLLDTGWGIEASVWRNWTYLHAAAVQSDLSAIRQLVLQKADVTVQDTDLMSVDEDEEAEHG